MSKIIRLTESDLIRLVKRVINEQKDPENIHLGMEMQKLGLKRNNFIENSLNSSKRDKNDINQYTVYQKGNNEDNNIQVMIVTGMPEKRAGNRMYERDGWKKVMITVTINGRNIINKQKEYPVTYDGDVASVNDIVRTITPYLSKVSDNPVKKTKSSDGYKPGTTIFN